MSTSGSVSSRRKQAKPQRLPHEFDLGSSVTNGHCDQALDCHSCGICSARFYDVDRFIEHKRICSAQKHSPVTPPSSDIESVPIDLSKKQNINDLEKKTILEDRSNFLLDLQSIQSQQQQLLELYAQLAASRSQQTTDSEQSSDDGGNTSSYIVSPPSSNGAIEKIHPCVADGCPQRFFSRGALLWHILRRHPGEKLLQCENCDERFSDPDQIREHRCNIPQRSTSAGALERSTSPDADRGSVPARTVINYHLVTRSPSPAAGTMATGTAQPLSRMLFSQLFQNPVANTPSTSSPIGDAALDLSNPIQNRPFLPIPTLPQHLIRPPFNFGLVPQRPPHPDLFLNGPSSGSLLNNDDDWEALMEVSVTDESEKIRALVGDKALPTTDPNQCLLCRRVLSCKSALQMHYRTHTGERPFKCKICQRAFTTKGNLKTHMGVHRAKHSFRGVAPSASVHHQCPICQKRFFTAQLLQQHIAHHTSQLTRNGLLPPFDISPTAQQNFDRRNEISSSTSMPSSTSNSGSLLQVSGTNFVVPLKNDINSVPFVPPYPFFPLGLSQVITNQGGVSPSNTQTPGTAVSISSQGIHRPEARIQRSEPIQQSGAVSRPESLPTIPLTMDTMLSPGIIKTEDDEVASTSSSQYSNVPCTPNTCSICYRSFPFRAALDIHMRSHDRDAYKCNECEQTFTSKMAQKQHVQAHRNLKYPRSPEGSLTEETMKYKEGIRMDASEEGNMKESEEQLTRAGNHRSETTTAAAATTTTTSTSLTGTLPAISNTPNPLDAMQKMWAETEPPPPRQAPVLSKHQCGVCFKHFSSSSALQIHMRTHTGDKPFKCEVCSRAFTTRGNLKVHMGTHMWQQSPSRRGRRIFEFGAEGMLRPEMIPSLALGAEGGLRSSFESVVRPTTLQDTASRATQSTAFPVLPFPLPLLPATTSTGAASSQMDAVMWMWKTVCSVCQKVCATPQELEQHLRMHLNGTASTESGNSQTMLLQKSE